MAGKSPHDRLELRIAAVATRQRGVIARDQLRALGLTDAVIDHRVARGRLVAVHRSVYLIAGAVLTIPARELAAVLACRPASAFVSHRSAAYRLSVLPYPAHYPTIDLVTAAPGLRSRPGLHVHRVSGLDPGDTITAGDLPVTSIRRTLLDLASITGGRELERALAAAQRDHQLEPATLLAYLDRHPHRRGVGRLRQLLSGDHPPAFTRSEAEERLLALVRARGLPDPVVNARVGRYEVDFLWPEAGLVVEVDGWRWHGDKFVASRDKQRDADLAALGYRVIRITWDRLVGAPEAVAAHIRRALSS